MQLTVDAKELKSAVTWTSKIIRKPVLPILDCVLLSAEDGKVTVRATNLDITLTRNVKATISEPGAVVVNAKALKGHLGKVKGKNATASMESYISKGEGYKLPMLALEANGIRVTLPTQDPEDYPLAANATWDHSFTFDPDAVSLKRVAKFADH